MRFIRRIFTILLLLLLLLLALGAAGGYFFVRRSFPTTDGTLQVPGLSEHAEVFRDQWGVSHIFADNRHDLFFAQGYVHAQDRLWQMEFFRRIGAGTLSEVLGEATLDTDRFLRTVGLHRAAQRDWEGMDGEMRAILQAYADGVNAYVEMHRNRLPLEFTILGFKPEPWTPVDSLAWGKVMAWNLGGNWDVELLRARLIDRLGREKASELLPPYPDAAPVIVPPEMDDYAFLRHVTLASYRETRKVLGTETGLWGSNNWVVHGDRTATGMPLLANDPHLGMQMPSIWYENGLHGAGFNVVGASFPGTAGVVIGHNERVAWGVTNLGPDVQDLYVERIDPQNPHRYEFEGAWHEMDVIREEIAVDGRDEPEVLEVRVTRHGPLLNDVVDGLERPTALRWTGLEASSLAKSVVRLDLAQNWGEFREALRLWDVPSQNFVYADVDGNIGYQAPGRIPVRANGQGLVPVPGWTGEYEWQGYVPFDELPSVFNPERGFIVTANNRVVSDDYPHHLAYEWSAPYRARRITDLIQEKETLSVQDFERIQADTYSIRGQILMPYLLDLPPEGWLQERTFEQARDWDLYSEPDRTGAGIFEVFSWKLVENTFADELGEDLLDDYLGASSEVVMAVSRLVEDPQNDWFDDVSTPGQETRDDVARRAFEDAVDFLGDRFGDVPHEWTWGRLHTITFVHQPLGESGIRPLELLFNRGGGGAPGSAFTVNAAGFGFDDPFAMGSGVSYRQIIDLGDLENSRSMHTTGQSGQVLHSHYDDMIEPWQAVEYHPMLFDRATEVARIDHILVLEPR